jgi:hypothetical protein
MIIALMLMGEGPKDGGMESAVQYVCVCAGLSVEEHSMWSSWSILAFGPWTDATRSTSMASSHVRVKVKVTLEQGHGGTVAE